MEAEQAWRRVGLHVEGVILGPTAYDHMTLAEFARHFPREHRDSRNVAELYDSFRAHRAQVRDAAKREMARAFMQMRGELLPSPEAMVEGFSLDAAIELLEGLSASLSKQAEILDSEAQSAAQTVRVFEKKAATLSVRGAAPERLDFPVIDQFRQAIEDECRRLVGEETRGSAGEDAGAGAGSSAADAMEV
eukprot:Amastigsp_a677406_39.p1 type:complete len:191 gc:universal Amastigsp_a677406_39:590-18(-)